MTATYCFWLHPPTPIGRQIEIWDCSLQLHSSSGDSNQAECMGGDEGPGWCTVALIFPSSSIYRISFNNAQSFRGHRRAAQPFRTTGHRGGSVWRRRVGAVLVIDIRQVDSDGKWKKSWSYRTGEKDGTKWVSASYSGSDFFICVAFLYF